MTQEVAVGGEVLDFGIVQEVKFKVNGELFEGLPDLPAETAMAFAENLDRLQGDNSITTGERIEIMRGMFRLILKPESAERFIARMSDPERPIGAKALKDLIPWLFEQYGERPTEPSSDSSPPPNGQAPGTSLTASSLDEGSISGVSI